MTGKALEIIEDHNIALSGLGIEEGEQRHHAGALHEIPAARDIIGKDRHNIVSSGFRMLAAAMLLTLQP